MQRDEIVTDQEIAEENKPQWNAEVAFGAATIRIAGLVVFIVLNLIAIMAGAMNSDDFLNLLSDVYVTIPLVVGSYLLRFSFQFIVLRFFSGLGRKQVRVGFSDRNISPFVHARRPFILSRFRWYLIVPLLAIVLLLVGMMAVFGIPFFLFGLSFVLAFCVNDVASFFLSFRFPGHMLAADHPSRFGFVLFDNPFHAI